MSIQWEPHQDSEPLAKLPPIEAEQHILDVEDYLLCEAKVRWIEIFEFRTKGIRIGEA